jgi:hypothetical protein
MSQQALSLAGSDAEVVALAQEILIVIRKQRNRVMVSAALNIAGELWTVNGLPQDPQGGPRSDPT